MTIRAELVPYEIRALGRMPPVEMGALRSGIDSLSDVLDRILRRIETDPTCPPSPPSRGSETATAVALDLGLLRSNIVRLCADLPRLPRERLLRISLNQDIPQLTYHLGVELAHWTPAPGPRERLRRASSLQFLTRHVRNLERELDLMVYRSMPVSHRLLLYRLHELTRERFRRFRRFYLGDAERPFLDKFYRDYCQTGVPRSLVTRLSQIARNDAFDLYIGVLRGGLPYLLLLEALGIPASKIRHVVCGRTTGSHLGEGMRFEAAGFSPGELKGRRILLIDNNLMTGKTLELALRELEAYGPASVSILLDYVHPGIDGRVDSEVAARISRRVSELIIAQAAGAREATGAFHRIGAEQLQSISRGLDALDKG